MNEIFYKNNKTHSLKAFRQKNRETLVISEPFGFKHIQHIGIDAQMNLTPTSNQLSMPTIDSSRNIW